MADRVLRGSRLGAVSYETDRDHDLAPRRVARYRCDNGEEFDVPFADDAEIPGTWACRNGLEGSLIEGTAPEGVTAAPTVRPGEQVSLERARHGVTLVDRWLAERDMRDAEVSYRLDLDHDAQLADITYVVSRPRLARR